MTVKLMQAYTLAAPCLLDAFCTTRNERQTSSTSMKTTNDTNRCKAEGIAGELEPIDCAVKLVMF
jgi:hypothetical protein